MKKSSLLLIILFSGCSLQSVYIKPGIGATDISVPRDSVVHTLFLIGDAGAPVEAGDEPVLNVLTDSASYRPENNTVIFLGDNIYPAGLPAEGEPGRAEMEWRLNEQITVATASGARTIFIPGNHDWDRQGNDGRATLRRQEEFIKTKNHSGISFLPSGGLPGPAVIDIGGDIRIIAIDTQWWLHAYEKPFYAHTATEDEAKRLLLDSLSQMLTTDRRTVVVAHHPLESNGEHGGFFDWRDHLFPLRHFSDYLWIPLPGIGSLYPLSRMWGITDQDFAGETYTELRIALDSVLSRKPPVAYISGHEHTLQMLEPRTGYYHIISGFGMKSHISPLTARENTIFARLAPGFMAMEFLEGGGICLRVIEVTETGGEPVGIFSFRLR